MTTAEFILEIKNGKLGVKAKIPYLKNEKKPEIKLNRDAVVDVMELNRNTQFKKEIDATKDYFVRYGSAKQIQLLLKTG